MFPLHHVETATGLLSGEWVDLSIRLVPTLRGEEMTGLLVLALVLAAILGPMFWCP